MSFSRCSDYRPERFVVPYIANVDSAIEEKDSVIKDYLDSLDIKQKELDKQIDEDEDLSKVRDAIDFMKSVATGETKLENIEEKN